MRHWPTLMFLALASALPAHASDYPSRPVHIYTTSGTGTIVDIATRFLADKLSKHFKQNFVVENKSKANGQIVAQDFVSEKPDGYSLLVGTGGTFTVLPAMRSTAQYKPSDYTPVSIVANDMNLMLVANSAIGVKTMDDLMRYTAAHKSPVGFAVGGFTARATSRLLTNELSINARFVPYRSPYAIMPDLRNGEVKIAFVYPSDFAALQDAVHPVVCLCTRRSAAHPNIPTIGEFGHEDIGIAGAGWAALVAPKGLPPDILKKLSDGIRAVLAEPDVKAFGDSIGAVLEATDPEETKKHFERAYEIWRAKAEKYPELKEH